MEREGAFLARRHGGIGRRRLQGPLDDRSDLCLGCVSGDSDLPCEVEHEPDGLAPGEGALRGEALRRRHMKAGEADPLDGRQFGDPGGYIAMRAGGPVHQRAGSESGTAQTGEGNPLRGLDPGIYLD